MTDRIFYKLGRINYKRGAINIGLRYYWIAVDYGSVDAMVDLTEIYFNNNQFEPAEKLIDLIIATNDLEAINKIVKYCKSLNKIHLLYMKAIENNEDKAMWYSLLLLNKV
jgi:hypothetical protein